MEARPHDDDRRSDDADEFFDDGDSVGGCGGPLRIGFGEGVGVVHEGDAPNSAGGVSLIAVSYVRRSKEA